ncbi:hypothetical protein KCP69_25600 [Salmonella enterica subsp. enterica]|nr:hypothetical protein KCP69_25600 [Salmonella enterica subsp. enterica]
MYTNVTNHAGPITKQSDASREYYSDAIASRWKASACSAARATEPDIATRTAANAAFCAWLFLLLRYSLPIQKSHLSHENSDPASRDARLLFPEREKALHPWRRARAR